MGRFARKGERGIPILTPVTIKVDEDDMKEHKLIGF